jgi:YVTN family beta-propeller protein
LLLAGFAVASCGGHPTGEPAPTHDSGELVRTTTRLPLVTVSDVGLPGAANRFDYQDVDPARNQLVIAHMNDASVLVVDLRNGSLLKLLPNIRTARGIAVASDVGKIFVTSSPNQLVVIDSTTLTEVTRVATGNAPDGVGWDPVHQTVGVSDQRDGAVSLIREAGAGAREHVPVGVETGNVVFDARRATFWVTVVTSSPPNQLVQIDPVTARPTTRIDLPGCEGAHGLRLHPDGQSALIACEDNSMLVRVDLEGAHALTKASTGDGPDVLAMDPGLGWLYVAAESGDLTVFDISRPGLNLLDREHPGNAAHSVAVDPSTHRVFFPLVAGPAGTPVLRIMKPQG